MATTKHRPLTALNPGAPFVKTRCHGCHWPRFFEAEMVDGVYTFMRVRCFLSSRWMYGDDVDTCNDFKARDYVSHVSEPAGNVSANGL